MESFFIEEKGKSPPCHKCGHKQFKALSPHQMHGPGLICAQCGCMKWWGKLAKDDKQKPNNSLKKLHLAKGEYCRFCGITKEEARAMGRTFDAVLDHQLARDFGGEHTPENTQILCGLCSYLKTAMEHQTRMIRKMMEKFHENCGPEKV
jgi:hypothetical protein